MSLFKELKRRNVFRVGIAYTVATWLLIQVTDTVFPRIGLPDSAVTLVIALLAVGFIPALIFAWAFEMTPEGIKREKDVDRTQSITPTTGRKLDRAIIGIMAVVIAFLVLDRFVLTDESAQPVAKAGPAAVVAEEKTVPAAENGPSVAVLPFVNMSGNADNEYFSDGLTETLLHMLAQLPDLRVAARTSSFAFKGQNASIGDIATTLGVAHILEGSVQRAGDRVRITAQLVRADDGFHIWSQNYDRTLEDIFAIQDEIAGDVAQALNVSLLGGGSTLRGVETTDLTAYEHYLKGLEQKAIFSYGSLPVAENHFKQALASDPGFTDARLALVENYLLKYSTGLMDNTTARQSAEPLIQQVLQDHPGNQLARILQITLELQLSDTPFTVDELKPMLDELLELSAQNPTESTFARTTAASFLEFFFNDPQAALDTLNAGLLVDPMDADLYNSLGTHYTRLERFDEAFTALKRAQELEPDYPVNYTRIANLELARNNLPAALEWYRRSTEVDNRDHELVAQMAIIFYELGLPEEGDYWRQRVVALAPDSPMAKMVELNRLLAKDEKDHALKQARSMISEQIEDRHGAFVEALIAHEYIMLETGKAEEAYDFLVSVRPEIVDYSALPDDLNGLWMQWSSIGLMSHFVPPEEHRKAWAKLTAAADATGFPWRDPDNALGLWVPVFAGDIESAVNLALEHLLSPPLAANLWKHPPMEALMFPEVFADPRIQARMTEIQEEYESLRRQARALVSSPEWNQ